MFMKHFLSPDKASNTYFRSCRSVHKGPTGLVVSKDVKYELINFNF